MHQTADTSTDCSRPFSPRLAEVLERPRLERPLLERPIPLASRSNEADGYSAELFERVLDEIDYGVVLLTAQLRVGHANRTARHICQAVNAPCRIEPTGLRLPDPVSQGALDRAMLSASSQARRSLVRIPDPTQPMMLATVPLGDWGGLGATLSRVEPTFGSATPTGAPVLVLFSRRQMCETLSVEFFARAYNLTHAETMVLNALCRGAQPGAIAEQSGVAVSTVRTQISSIRQKTGSSSIGELVRQVAVLPPIVPALASWKAH